MMRISLHKGLLRIFRVRTSYDHEIFFLAELGIHFENWVKKKEIRGEFKSRRKESLFPKEATQKE